MWGVTDPNWGDPQIIEATIRPTEAEAIDAACWNEQHSLYSGAVFHVEPQQRGNWDRMKGFGYATVEISDDNAGAVV